MTVNQGMPLAAPAAIQIRRRPCCPVDVATHNPSGRLGVKRLRWTRVGFLSGHVKALRHRVLKFIFSDPLFALSRTHFVDPERGSNEVFWQIPRTHFVGLLLYLAGGFAFSSGCDTSSRRRWPRPSCPSTHWWVARLRCLRRTSSGTNLALSPRLG